MKVRFSAAAEADLDHIYIHIAETRPRTAADMLERLIAAADALGDFPMIGRSSGQSGERELATVHPYVIVYALQEGAVVIIRIYHGAQDR